VVKHIAILNKKINGSYKNFQPPSGVVFLISVLLGMIEVESFYSINNKIKKKTIINHFFTFFSKITIFDYLTINLVV